MSTSFAQRSSFRRQPFTLVEMLTVLAIVAVLMGIVAGVVVSTKEVDGGARMVSKQLYLARQYAISQREYVAIVFPDGNIDPGAQRDAYEDYLGKAFRSCIVSKSGSNYHFERWVRGSEWAFLPGGVEMDLTDLERRFPGGEGFTFHSTGSQFYDAPCVIFDSRGSLAAGTHKTITIKAAGDSPDVRRVNLTINWLTGRSDWEKE